MKRLGLVSLLALAWADPALAQAVPELSSEPGGVAARGGFVVPMRAVPTPVAPAATQIDPDTLPGRDLGTTVTPAGPVYTIDGGSRVGNNLFHSFATFDLAAGDTAQWIHTTGNPLTLENVVNRVTGGTPSQLFGTLDSTAIPNADFYFINPAGIVFGATAQVNVPAAAHFSTASELRFATGPAFSVAAPDGSTLNVAAPQAFGFLGNEGGILVTGVDFPFLPNEGILTLSAGDVTIENSAFNAAELAISAVGANAVEIGIDGSTSDFLAGQLVVFNSTLGTSLGSGGNLLLQGGGVVVDSSLLTTGTVDATDSGDIRIFGDTVDVLSSTLLSGSFNVFGEPVPGSAGDIVIGASGTLTVDGSVLASEASCTGAGCVTGNAGIIDLFGNDVVVLGSEFRTNVGDTGLSGGITVNAVDGITVESTFMTSARGFVSLVAGGNLDLTNATIFADSFGSGSAFGGSIFLQGNNVTIDSSFITTDNFTDGAGASSGFIQIEAADLLWIRNGTTLSLDTFGSGDAGFLLLQGGNVLIEDSTITSSSNCFVDGCAAGNAGNISINAANLLTVSVTELRSNATCSANACTSGNAGFINLAGTDIDLLNSTLTTEVAAGAQSGGVSATATNSLDVEGTFISSTSGFVSLSAGGDLQLTSSTIFADSFDSGAAFGGFISLLGTNVTIQSSFITTENFTQSGTASGGFIAINASQQLSILNTTLSLDTFGSGDAGSLSLGGGTVLIENSSISSDSSCFGDGCVAGNAGNIVIEAVGELAVDNSILSSTATCFGADCTTGNAGFLLLTGGTVRVDFSDLSSNANCFEVGCVSGNAGIIGLEAVDITLVDSRFTTDVGGDGLSGGFFASATNNLRVDNSFISSNRGFVSLTAGNNVDLIDTTIFADNFGTGEELGGAIFVDGRNVTIDNSFITAENFTPAGGFFASGLISFNATDTLILRNGTRISLDAFGDGEAGQLDLTGRVILIDASSVTSDSTGAGLGGSIFVDATERLAMSNGALIGAQAFGAGGAGFVVVDAPTVTLAGNSAISTQSAIGSTGNAGTVTVTGNSLRLSDSSFISSSTFGAGSAGGVFIDVGEVLVSSASAIASQSGTPVSGAGGVVDIVADTVTVEGAGFIDTSTFSAQPAGDVNIAAGTVTVRNGGFITSVTAGGGNAGNVRITADTLAVQSAGEISTSTLASGNAGLVEIDARLIEVDGGLISSSAEPGATGASGSLDITATEAVSVIGGGGILTESNNNNAAGVIFVAAPRVTVSGVDSRISSENNSAGPCGATECAAGLIRISTLGDDAEGIFLRDGGRITTNSDLGPAGNIELLMAEDTILVLEGRENPGVIETSSGPGTGGVITISRPLAIVSNGGRISALGQSGGANVLIDTPFFIASADRLNVVEVAGALEFTSAISDVSAGTVSPDLTVLDASGVLRGQCSAQRASGQLSQFSVRSIGPYAPPVPPSTGAPPPPPVPGAGNPGDCL